MRYYFKEVHAYDSGTVYYLYSDLEKADESFYKVYYSYSDEYIEMSIKDLDILIKNKYTFDDVWHNYLLTEDEYRLEQVK